MTDKIKPYTWTDGPTSPIPDRTPGAFYVSCENAGRRALLVGPFATHVDAITRVDDVRKLAERLDPRAVFYAFGTSRAPVGTDTPGKINDLFYAVPRP